jgi:hypothetical protein
MHKHLALPVSGNNYIQDLALTQLNGRDAKDFVDWLLTYWHLVSPGQRDVIVGAIFKRQADHGLTGEAYRAGGRYGYWQAVIERQANALPLDYDLFDTQMGGPTQARVLAVWAHDGAGQLYAGLPYSVHLAGVVQLAITYGKLLLTEDWAIAVSSAWLHDVIEDGYYTYEKLVPLVGERVARVAQLCVSSTGATRAERHDAAYHARVSSDRVATFVKLCDRLANVNYGGRAMGKYVLEQASFEEGLRLSTEHPVLIPLRNALRDALELAVANEPSLVSSNERTY